MILKTGPLDWEYSTLTNRPVFVCPLSIFNESEICGISDTKTFDHKMFVQVPSTFTNLKLFCVYSVPWNIARFRFTKKIFWCYFGAILVL